MYNLIVTAEEGAWNRKSYAIPKDRFCEHTVASLKDSFTKLDKKAISKINSMPTLFLYERSNALPGYIGKITDINIMSRGEIRFNFEIFKGVKPISIETISDLIWDLDITDWELNRTHWAIKDIDLINVLQDADIVDVNWNQSSLKETSSKFIEIPHDQIIVSPDVFSARGLDRNAQLVALMMPFSDNFDSVHRSINEICLESDLICKRVDDIWDSSTIIQDIFSLLYTSEFVIADITGRNSNVFYEIGIAHTLGRPVIPISQDTKEIPFDLAHHRVLEYSNTELGLKKMQRKLDLRFKSLIP